MHYNNQKTELKDLYTMSNQRWEDYKELKNLGMLCLDDDFVPAIHYPPITMYPPIEYDEMFKGYTLPENGLMDVYVHIPFCTTRCTYCHYPSLYGSRDKEKEEYLDAMEKEMDIYMQTLGLDKIKLRVALVGGGTPTDLSPKQLDRFLQMLTSRCDMSHLQQFNFDVSPSSLVGKDGLEKLKIMKDYGVDRLTIGIQSMNERILKEMNRPCGKEVSYESIKNTLDAGYQLNIEFIFGYPGQTLEEWYEELQEIVTIPSHEYQFYRLKTKPYGDQEGSILKLKNNNILNFPSIENTIRMKQMIIDFLKPYGYFENLRRVFTKEKKHISLYAYDQCCALYDQMSFGLTAFSSLRNRFVLNTQSFDEYYKRISEGKLPFNRGYVRDEIAQQRWAIILPLKNYFIRKNMYKKFTGTDIKDTKFYRIFDILKQHDLIEEDEYKIKLTSKGSFFADEVCELFYAPKFIPFERNNYKEGILNPYHLNSMIDKQSKLYE